MKITPPLPLAVITVVAAAIAIPLLTSPETSAQESDTAWTGQKWEYRALRIADQRRSAARDRDLGALISPSQETLNQLGAQGWELVTVRNDGTTEPVFYLKRPKS